jgi:tripartite-type tricarboxylate transporter receptor subunit TctC
MSCLNGVLIVCSLLAPCVASAQTSAQTAAQSSPANWPTRPVTLIIPYAPGSNTEFEPRLYASKLTETYGKQFLLDFRPGGGTLLAAQYTAKAPADGHTLMVITATFPLLPLMFRDAGFDPIKAFAAVWQMSKRSTLFVISNSLPASNVREYIANARANPGKVNFATTGIGVPSICTLSGCTA